MESQQNFKLETMGGGVHQNESDSSRTLLFLVSIWGFLQASVKWCVEKLFHLDCLLASLSVEGDLTCVQSSDLITFSKKKSSPLVSEWMKTYLCSVVLTD